MTQLVASFLSSMGRYLRNLPNFSSLKITVSSTQRCSLSLSLSISLSHFNIKMIPLWFGRKSRRCFDFARIMSPYVNHRRNARVDVWRAIHTRWKKGKGIVHTANEDDPIRKALHSLQHTVARSADDDDEMQRRRGRLCLRFIYAEYKRRGNRHGRPCPSGLPNCVVPTRSPQPRKNDQGKSRVKIPAARGHGQVNFTLSNQVSPLVSRYDWKCFRWDCGILFGAMLLKFRSIETGILREINYLKRLCTHLLLDRTYVSILSL